MEQKKRSVGAAERDEWLRAAWRVTLAQHLDPSGAVRIRRRDGNPYFTFSDLCLFTEGTERESVVLGSPRNRGPNTTLLSCMSVEVMGASSLTVEGATNRDVFEAYVERVLAPELRPGQVVVMDNLTAHKGERVRELIEERGSELLYLPPYSPDFTIRLKKPSLKDQGSAAGQGGGSHARGALVEAMGIAISLRSVRTMHEASSSTAVTVHEFNYYDQCCRFDS